MGDFAAGLAQGLGQSSQALPQAIQRKAEIDQRAKARQEDVTFRQGRAEAEDAYRNKALDLRGDELQASREERAADRASRERLSAAENNLRAMGYQLDRQNVLTRVGAQKDIAREGEAGQDRRLERRIDAEERARRKASAERALARAEDRAEKRLARGEEFAQRDKEQERQFLQNMLRDGVLNQMEFNKASILADEARVDQIAGSKAELINYYATELNYDTETAEQMADQTIRSSYAGNRAMVKALRSRDPNAIMGANNLFDLLGEASKDGPMELSRVLDHITAIAPEFDPGPAPGSLGGGDGALRTVGGPKVDLRADAKALPATSLARMVRLPADEVDSALRVSGSVPEAAKTINAKGDAMVVAAGNGMFRVPDDLDALADAIVSVKPPSSERYLLEGFDTKYISGDDIRSALQSNADFTKDYADAVKKGFVTEKGLRAGNLNDWANLVWVRSAKEAATPLDKLSSWMRFNVTAPYRLIRKGAEALVE